MMNALRKNGRPAGNARFPAGLLLLVLTGVFVLSLTGVAFSRESMPAGARDTLRGEVVAVDTGHYIRTLTLESGQIGPFPNNELNFFMTGSTKVNICGMRSPAGDIQAGRHATVTYHEAGGAPVADSVSERC